jgi:hypothetical protein
MYNKMNTSQKIINNFILVGDPEEKGMGFR